MGGLEVQPCRPPSAAGWSWRPTEVTAVGSRVVLASDRGDRRRRLGGLGLQRGDRRRPGGGRGVRPGRPPSEVGWFWVSDTPTAVGGRFKDGDDPLNGPRRSPISTAVDRDLPAVDRAMTPAACMQLRIQNLQVSPVRLAKLDPGASPARRRRRAKPDARPKGKPGKGRNPNQSALARAAIWCPLGKKDGRQACVGRSPRSGTQTPIRLRTAHRHCRPTPLRP